MKKIKLQLKITPEHVDLEAISDQDVKKLNVAEHGLMQKIQIKGTVPFVTAMEIARAVEKIMRKNHATQITEKDPDPGADSSAAGPQG